MELIDRLEREHADAVRALEALERACQAALADAPHDDWRGTLDAALRTVDSIVHGHAQSEEDLIFPALRGDGVDALLQTLVDDHQQVRALYERIRTELALWERGKAESASGWVEPARALRGRLAMHMQRENLMIFPKARRLPEGDRAAWAAR